MLARYRPVPAQEGTLPPATDPVQGTVEKEDSLSGYMNSHCKYKTIMRQYFTMGIDISNHYIETTVLSPTNTIVMVGCAACFLAGEQLVNAFIITQNLNFPLLLDILVKDVTVMSHEHHNLISQRLLVTSPSWTDLQIHLNTWNILSYGWHSARLQ